MDNLLTIAIEAARAAGEIALRYFRTDLAIEIKADKTPVTEADRLCEAKIVEVLGAAFPDTAFLGEEMGEQGSTGSGSTGSGSASGARWIIDPIDGTKNFIRGIPFFATLIALEEANEVTAGVIYAPATGDLLYAQKGQGAFANGRQVRVSTVSALKEAMLIHGGLGDLKRSPYWQPFVRLIDQTARQRGFGDALGHTLVICGHAEITLEPEIKPWDVAATKIIVQEAGGQYSDFSGSPSIYTGTAVISNGKVHQAVLGILQSSVQHG
jgi:histidinol-phosphatase